MLPFVVTEGLFSEHWLLDILPETAAWDQLDEAADDLQDVLSELLNRTDSFENLTEPALTKEFVDPILEALGHAFHIQVRTPAGDFPDYVLFETEEIKRQAEQELSNNRGEFFAHATGILEAKAWDTPLDKGGSRGARRDLDPAHPTGQLYGYMLRNEQRWGILTNGRKWRLYHYDGHWPRIGRYFEIDLPALHVREDSRLLKYFVYFFSAAAFGADSGNRSRLDLAREDTIEYARELEEDLEDAVYRALGSLANGFLRYPDNHLSGSDADDREAIHQGALKLLYRLLFTFKAEAAGLLPLENPVYRKQRSLDRIKHDIARRQDDPSETILNDSDEYYKELQRLFRLIDEGSAPFFPAEDPLGIPPYNGGLFHREDPVTGEPNFLSRFTIGDADLSKALGLLSRGTQSRSGDGGGVYGFVDYSTLEAQQLGTLYEGLLMYQLGYADGEDYVAAGEDGAWLPVSEHEGQEIADPERSAPAGSFYLRTDKGERHGTGSYYTPDFIVRYIVEKALPTVVERKLEEAREQGTSRREAILSINVIDPAMGSGHFLVSVVDFLTPHLLDAVEEDREESLLPEEVEITTEDARREIAAHCIYGVDLNPMAVELAKVTIWLHTLARGKPLTFLDHRLKVGNTLLGADIRKISRYPKEELRDRWADEIEALRTERPERRMEALSSFPPLFLERIVGRLERIEDLTDDTLDDVKKKEQIYGELRGSPEFRKVKTVCDAWLAAYFGEHTTRGGSQETASKNYSDLQWALHESGSEAEWDRKAKKANIPSISRLAEERSFFHWEIEFPEVFFEEGSLKDESGFDVVVGNPPYMSIVTLHDQDPELMPIYKQRYAAGGHGRYDIYVLFVEQGLDLLRQEGQFGYIIPNKWFKGEFGRPLRNITSRRELIREIVDWRDYYNLFPGAVTFVSLVFLSRDEKESFRYVEFPGLEPTDSPEKALRLLEESRRLEPGANAEIVIGDIPIERLSGDSWAFAVGRSQELLERLSELPSFGSVANVFEGVTPGAVPVFILKEAEFSADGSTVRAWSKEIDDFVELEAGAVRPVLNGRDVKRWERVYDEDVIIWPYEKVQEDAEEKVRLIPPAEMEREFPETWAYLNRPEIREKLEGRERGRFEGTTEWYQFSYTRSMKLFDQSKVLLPDAASQGDAAWDPRGAALAHTLYGVVPREGSKWAPFALQALLNTTLLTFWVQHKSSSLKDRYFRFQTKYIEPFPIPEISWETDAAERTRLKEEASQLIGDIESGVEVDVAIGWVQTQLDAGRPDVVHDALATIAKKIDTLYEENFQERKQFLAWLKDNYLAEGSRLGDFAGKTILREYHGVDLEKILSILRKNKDHLTVDPTSRSFHERFSEEFSMSVEEQTSARRKQRDSSL